MALAEGPRDWQRALHKITIAINDRPTPIALYVRAWLRFIQSHDTGDLGAAESALSDLKYAQLFLGESPDVIHLKAQLNRFVYELTKHSNLDAAKRNLAEVEGCVEQLERFPTFRLGTLNIIQYYDCVDEFDRLMAAASKVDFGDTIFIDYVAGYIYRHIDTPRATLNRFRTLRYDQKNPWARIAERTS